MPKKSWLFKDIMPWLSLTFTADIPKKFIPRIIGLTGSNSHTSQEFHWGENGITPFCLSSQQSSVHIRQERVFAPFPTEASQPTWLSLHTGPMTPGINFSRFKMAAAGRGEPERPVVSALSAEVLWNLFNTLLVGHQEQTSGEVIYKYSK